MQNLSQNELNQIKEMRDQTRFDLERITKIRIIKNYEQMSKEELIISPLKSKQNIAEIFNDNLDDDDDDDDDDKISDIRRILNRLRDMLPKKYRKEIKEKLYEIENNEDLSEAEKEQNDGYLRKLIRILNNKETHGLYYRDNFDYYGIRDIENLFGEVSEEDYYKPILVKSSFKCNYKYYKSRGDKEKYLFKDLDLLKISKSSLEAALREAASLHLKPILSKSHTKAITNIIKEMIFEYFLIVMRFIEILTK